MLHMTLRYWNIGYVFIVWQRVYLKKCFLESKTLPSINRYPIYKEKKTFLKKKKKKNKTKQNKTQFSMVKSQLMVYQNE